MAGSSVEDDFLSLLVKIVWFELTIAAAADKYFRCAVDYSGILLADFFGGIFFGSLLADRPRVLRSRLPWVMGSGGWGWRGCEGPFPPPGYPAGLPLTIHEPLSMADL